MRLDYIRKRNGKYVVLSEAGKTLGTHETRAGALSQLRAVEYHKAHDETAQGGNEISPEAPPRENLETERAEELTGLQRGKLPDILGDMTDEHIAGYSANLPQPDEEGEELDEGNPNQYEMFSTAIGSRQLEGSEPNFAEVAPNSGPDDRAASPLDPSGDDDFLRAVGGTGLPAQPSLSGNLLE